MVSLPIIKEKLKVEWGSHSSLKKTPPHTLLAKSLVDTACFHVKIFHVKTCTYKYLRGLSKSNFVF